MTERRYCLISPCRDEQATARATLESVTRQSRPPALWVIVDDGSSDATPAILEEYAERFDYIRIVRRDNRGRRSVGPGVVDAFYAGLETLDLRSFDYLCKLDLDLDLPPRYFETLIERMEADPRLGTCSGKPYFPGPNNPEGRRDGELISEGCGDEVSVGMAKFYRTACFEQLGGFVQQVMWDGIDCHRCRMLGWTARSLDEPGLRFVHLRPMGSSDGSVLKGRMRHGYGQYFMGTHLPYITASALSRMTRSPRIVGGLAIWWGYIKAMLRREPRYGDAEFIRFLRRYQWQCLLRGKREATRRIEAQYEPVWHHHNSSELRKPHASGPGLSWDTPPSSIS